jgi:hypothetical protein
LRGAIQNRNGNKHCGDYGSDECDGQGDLAPQLDLQASVMSLDKAFEYLFIQLRKSKQEM